ncbi:hypothetical protein BC835DRAFT_1027016 [Cytidiella melzeri]|nr:hypothetical protein BC835DRAFT_1027016 [Cytidiella melzeri]
MQNCCFVCALAAHLIISPTFFLFSAFLSHFLCTVSGYCAAIALATACFARWAVKLRTHHKVRRRLIECLYAIICNALNTYSCRFLWDFRHVDPRLSHAAYIGDENSDMGDVMLLILRY